MHRDLKPRNVLIDASDQVYVSDFGLAKSLEAESTTMMTRAGEVLGTPRYMSPEQAESKPADHRSDLYSFGVILYEMATGDAPFAGDSTMQVMYQHVTQKPKDPKLVNPDLPDYLSRIILKCLEKNPNTGISTRERSSKTWKRLRRQHVWCACALPRQAIRNGCWRRWPASCCWWLPRSPSLPGAARYWGGWKALPGLPVGREPSTSPYSRSRYWAMRRL